MLIVSTLIIYCYNRLRYLRTWYELVRVDLQTPGHALAVSIVQLIVLLLVCISRVITAARAMQNVSKLICTHSGCFSSYAAFCGIFGAMEILLSMVPSLEEASWISVFGSCCSMVYLVITVILGFVKGTSMHICYDSLYLWSVQIGFLFILVGNEWPLLFQRTPWYHQHILAP